MSDEDEVRTMTADEIGLMREIVKWRRNHGVTYWRARNPIGRFCQWKDDGDRWSRRSVGHDLGDPYVSAGAAYSAHDIRVPVQSVTQAVDVLVALGYLPARFSSAYRAGWDSSTLWHDPDVDPAAFRKAFHDPWNISLPALDPTW